MKRTLAAPEAAGVKNPRGRKGGQHPTPLPVARIVAAHRAGVSINALADRFGVSRATIRDRLKSGAVAAHDPQS